MTGWDGVEEFVAVATSGSFNGGAKVLGMSGAHVSRAVARLETRLQCQLLTRTTRSVRLTDTGRALLEHCRRMIVERDEAFAMVNERGEPQGHLRVTCSTAMGERFVAPILTRYCERNPKLDVTIDLTNRLVDLVAEGYDLAIRTGHLADSRLIGCRIASRRLLTCASPAYLAAHGRPARISDLRAHHCLVGTATTWHFRVDGKEEIFRPKARWHCNSGVAVIDAAVGGMGICQLPEFYVLSPVSLGLLEVVLDEIRPQEEPIWAVYPQRRHLSPKISQLVEILQAELPGLLGTPAAAPPFLPLRAAGLP